MRQWLSHRLEWCREILHGDGRWRVLLLLSLGALLITKVHIPGSFDEFRVNAFEDDAYYYTAIATNFWQYGFPTFDGLTHTNGYQPLWMLITILTAAPIALCGVESYMPFALSLVNAAIILLATQVLFSMLRREGYRAHTAALCCVVALGIPLGSYIFNLMETASTIMCVLLILIYLQRILQLKQQMDVAVFAALSFLLLMSRLDAGILLLMLYAVLLLFVPIRKIVLSGILLCIVTLPYFAYNYLLNASIMPISGMVKSRWSAIAEFEADGHKAASLSDYWFSNVTWGRRLLDARNGLAEPLSEFLEFASFGKYLGADSTPEPFSVAFIVLVFSVVLGVVAVYIFGLAYSWKKSCSSRRMLGMSLILLLVFYVFQLFYYPFFSHIIYTWYLGLGLSALLCCGFLAITGVVSFFHLQWGKPLALLMLALIIAMDLSAWKRERAIKKNLYLPQNAIADTAEWLKKNTPQDALIGSWTAGQVGQSSQRRVINLEGLVADAKVLATFDNMDMGLYFLDMKIDYVTNHFPDFQDGLWSPGSQRPDWVDMETWHPSISALWKILTHTKITWGETYTRWGWNVFWAHRYRPFWDYPEAFTVVYKRRAQHSAVYVFAVNHEKLKSAIEYRYGVAAIAPRIAHTFEAEHGVMGEEVRAPLYLPRSSVYAVTGTNLQWQYDLPDDGEFKVYALLRPSVNGIDCEFNCNGINYLLTQPASQKINWMLFPITQDYENVPDGKLSIKAASLMGAFNADTREETATFIDQFIVLEKGLDEKEFSRETDQLLSWMNREPHIPLDPDPIPPRIPTDF